MAQFGDEMKNKFNEKLKGFEPEVTLFGDIVKARHKVAHSGGVHKSFKEVSKGINAAEIIIKAMKETLHENLL
ncbi:hypothetical protein JWG39_04150 [Desulforhopalus vacuolatus]|nr:hypothetical protein [Desulforhopalus vacuolatus]